MINKRSNSIPAKRILLIRNAASYDFGGAERFVINLGDELQQLGWQVTVASRHKEIGERARLAKVPFKKSPWLQSWQDWSGLRIALFPGYLIWQLYLIAWYVWLCKRLRVSVIHPQSRDDFIAATIAGKLLGLKVIWTDHADLKYVYQNVPVPIKNPVGKWVWRTSKKADAVTLVSHSEARLIARALAIEALPDHYQVIYNGVSDTPVQPLPRAATDKDAVVFCATSRLVTAKGIGELISAFEQVDQAIDARLWIVGDGPEAERFKAQATNQPHITFMGFQEDVHPIVAAADVFVHPSYHEGFSISIVEAARLAKPIIACSVGGNPEIIHNTVNGLLIPSQDADALATAMLQLGKNAPLRAQYGAAARQIFTENFEFDRIVAERFVPLYEQ